MFYVFVCLFGSVKPHQNVSALNRGIFRVGDTLSSWLVLRP